MKTRIRYGAATDIGLVREINEDSKLHQPPLFAVADGMGGHMAGDVASEMAIATLSKARITTVEQLADAVQKANRDVYEKASSDRDLAGMGTTLLALWADPDEIRIAHVGDCRAYLVREGALSRLTKDHTVVERLVKEGRIRAEEADRHPQRSFLERALGIEPQVEIDIQIQQTQPGDRFLLCSDGLFGMLGDEDILAIMLSEPDPDAASRRLCRAAVEAGGRDNVTAIVIDYWADGVPQGGGPAAAPEAVSDTGSATAAPEAPPTAAVAVRRRGRLLVWAVVILLLAAAGAFAAVQSLDRSWFVGVHNASVAIFRGTRGSVAGVDFSKLEAKTSLNASSLPEPYRSAVREGIRAASRSDALSIVADLKRLAGPSPAPTPQASTTPGSLQISPKAAGPPAAAGAAG